MNWIIESFVVENVHIKNVIAIWYLVECEMLKNISTTYLKSDTSVQWDFNRIGMVGGLH